MVHHIFSKIRVPLNLIQFLTHMFPIFKCSPESILTNAFYFNAFSVAINLIADTLNYQKLICNISIVCGNSANA